MPYGNRTGPRGQGPGTGRGMGCCSGLDMAGYANRGGYFPGARRPYMNPGGGWGHRHWFHATGLPGWIRGARSCGRPYTGIPFTAAAGSPSDEMEFLKDEAVCLEEALAEIRDRISKMESVPETDENQTGG